MAAVTRHPGGFQIPSNPQVKSSLVTRHPGGFQTPISGFTMHALVTRHSGGFEVELLRRNIDTVTRFCKKKPTPAMVWAEWIRLPLQFRCQ